MAMTFSARLDKGQGWDVLMLASRSALNGHFRAGRKEGERRRGDFLPIPPHRLKERQTDRLTEMHPSILSD